MRQYYIRRDVFPAEILLKDLPDDADALSRFLSEAAGHAVKLVAPKRGDKRKLVDYAVLNAKEDAERAATNDEKIKKTIEWLGYACGMDTPPVRMEAFDISNQGDEAIAASMVVFVNGKPKKNSYRKFEIKSVGHQDDYHNMEEVVSRRAQRYLDGDEKFSPLPDLFLIDGGQTHAAAARRVLQSRGIDTPVFGMVKDNRHKTRALISPDGAEVAIDAYPSAFALIGTIQEETHRFALGYHNKLRSNLARKSKLDEIPGVGEKRRRDLLKSFGSLTAISEAPVEQLTKIVPSHAAAAIYEYFHPERKEDVSSPVGEGGEAT